MRGHAAAGVSPAAPAQGISVGAVMRLRPRFLDVVRNRSAHASRAWCVNDSGLAADWLMRVVWSRSVQPVYGVGAEGQDSARTHCRRQGHARRRGGARAIVGVPIGAGTHGEPTLRPRDDASTHEGCEPWTAHEVGVLRGAAPGSASPCAWAGGEVLPHEALVLAPEGAVARHVRGERLAARTPFVWHATPCARGGN